MRFPLTKVFPFFIGVMRTVLWVLDITLRKRKKNHLEIYLTPTISEYILKSLPAKLFVQLDLPPFLLQ